MFDGFDPLEVLSHNVLIWLTLYGKRERGIKNARNENNKAE